jgi:hypothetical protein
MNFFMYIIGNLEHYLYEILFITFLLIIERVFRRIAPHGRVQQAPASCVETMLPAFRWVRLPVFVSWHGFLRKGSTLVLACYSFLFVFKFICDFIKRYFGSATDQCSLLREFDVEGFWSTFFSLVWISQRVSRTVADPDPHYSEKLDQEPL